MAIVHTCANCAESFTPKRINLDGLGPHVTCIACGQTSDFHFLFVDKWQGVEIDGKAYDVNIGFEEEEGSITLYPTKTEDGQKLIDTQNPVFTINFKDGDC